MELDLGCNHQDMYVYICACTYIHMYIWACQVIFSFGIMCKYLLYNFVGILKYRL